MFDDGINVYVYILCLIELWTRSPKMEVENVYLNVFAGFCKIGKVRKTEETLADFSEKFNCLKKKKKRNFFFFTTSLPHYFLKIC